MIRYTLRKDTLISEYMGDYTSYGLNALDENGFIVRAVPDIAIGRTKLESLILLCNRLQLKIIHLDDVIEDFLSA